MRKFETSQKEESRAQSADSPEAYRKSVTRVTWRPAKNDAIFAQLR